MLESKTNKFTVCLENRLLRWQSKKKSKHPIYNSRLKRTFFYLTAKGSTSSAKVPGTWRTAPRPKAHRKLKVNIVVGKSRTVNLWGPQLRFIYMRDQTDTRQITNKLKGILVLKALCQALCQRDTCEISMRMYRKPQVCVYVVHIGSSWLLIRGHVCSLLSFG